MDKLLFRTLLLDFYGALLTERQRKAFEMHYLDDLSLNEMANELGISRQAAWDLVKRTEKLLENYEDKLALVKNHNRANQIYGECLCVLDNMDTGYADIIKEKLKELFDPGV